MIDAARIVKPMLAKASDVLPVGNDWLYEVKWDGVRCTATVENGQVTMQSRSAKSDFAGRYPAVAEALAEFADGHDLVLDGELVTPDENGDTFGIVAKGASRGVLIVFDVLQIDDDDQRGRSLEVRKILLEELFEESKSPKLLLSPVFDDGERLLKWASDRGIEGIVAKRRSSKYLEGRRGESWLKVKCRNEQEFVVVGWTPGKGARSGRIGALVLAAWKEGALCYVGRTGNRASFDRELNEKLRPLGPGKLPPASITCSLTRAEERLVTWVEPEIVVQVRFQKWSADRRLTHSTLLRLRSDKDASDVGFEA